MGVDVLRGGDRKYGFLTDLGSRRIGKSYFEGD